MQNPAFDPNFNNYVDPPANYQNINQKPSYSSTFGFSNAGFVPNIPHVSSPPSAPPEKF